jgi:soluble lytic murein transglycosylase-like protein
MTPPNQNPSSRRKRTLQRIARTLLAAVTLLAAIGYTASLMRPIYAGKTRVVGEMLRAVAPPAPVPASDTLLTGPANFTSGALADSVASIERSPEFAEQKRRFAADLVRTGRMSEERADSIAHFAVREAFLRGIPPAVIFGVMLTENAQFISRAQSNVGAVGLMQVYPKVWLKELSKRFGQSDIAADSTNLRYGVFILSNYLKPRAKGAPAQHVASAEPGTLMKGLLHYNGCVRGTNTPRCHEYPNKVQKFVERDAEALCGNQSFYQCIAKPFMAGLLGRTTAD